MDVALEALELEQYFLSSRPLVFGLFLICKNSSSVLQRHAVESTNSNLDLLLPESNESNPYTYVSAYITKPIE